MDAKQHSHCGGTCDADPRKESERRRDENLRHIPVPQVRASMHVPSACRRMKLYAIGENRHRRYYGKARPVEPGSDFPAAENRVSGRVFSLTGREAHPEAE